MRPPPMRNIATQGASVPKQIHRIESMATRPGIRSCRSLPPRTRIVDHRDSEAPRRSRQGRCNRVSQGDNTKSRPKKIPSEGNPEGIFE